MENAKYNSLISEVGLKAVIETLALLLFLGYLIAGTAHHGAFATQSTILFFSGFVLLSWEIWLRPRKKSERE